MFKQDLYYCYVLIFLITLLMNLLEKGASVDFALESHWLQFIPTLACKLVVKYT